MFFRPAVRPLTRISRDYIYVLYLVDRQWRRFVLEIGGTSAECDDTPICTRYF